LDKKDIWKALEIAETSNEDDIRQAYRKRLVFVNPEDDEEGFIRLREAYENAIQFVREPKVNSGEEKNEVDIWIDKIDGVYSSFVDRINGQCWKELFKDAVCVAVDTSLEAREKFLDYIMDHDHLPQEIWKIIDYEFNIMADKEQLLELFHKNFINYILRQIKEESFPEYTLFEVYDDENLDDYIDLLFDLEKKMNQDNIDSFYKIYEELNQYAVYHPYTDIQKMRFHILNKESDKAGKLSKELISKYPADSYICYFCGETEYALNNYEEAYAIFEDILEHKPSHYCSKIGLAKCLLMKKDCEKAKQILIDMLKIYPDDETLNSLSHEVNVTLISQYEEKCKENEHDYKSRLELAWCQYQNGISEESILNLEKLPEKIHKDYDYIKLIGRVHLLTKKYDVALEELKIWLDVILNTSRDESEMAKKRYHVLGYAYYLIGECYWGLKNHDDAIHYYIQSIDNEKTEYYKLSYMNSLAFVYIKSKKYEDCIHICDSIINISDDYYPAYLNRMEASFELRKDQAVIDDYHTAVEIYPDYIKPYLFAIKTFIRHKQIDNAKNVEDRVKELKLNSNEFQLQCIKIELCNTSVQHDMRQLIVECMEIKTHLDEEENDIEDKSRVDCELSRLYNLIKEYSKALEAIDFAILLNPNDENYYFTKGSIYSLMKDFENTICVLNGIVDRNPKSYRAYNEIANCYKDMKNMDQALECYLKAVEIKPDFYDGINNLSKLYSDKYTESEEEQYYELGRYYNDKLIELRENSYTLVHRGLLFMMAYKFDNALEDYVKTLEFDSENWAAHNNIGFVYESIREMDKAIEKFTKAMSLITIEKSQISYGNIAKCYLILKNYEEAMKYYLLLHNTKKRNTSYITEIANIYKNMVNYNQCKSWLFKLLEFENHGVKPYNELMDIAFMEGKLLEVNDYYKKGNNLEPENIDSIFNYARILYLSNRVEKSVKLAEQASEYANIDNKSSIKICENIAAIYWNNGILLKQNEKIESSNKYLKEAQVWGKEALYRIKKYFSSEEKYYSFKASGPRKLVSLASLYLYTGDSDKAEVYIKMALSEVPCRLCKYFECIDAYEKYGMLYESRSYYEEAIECYNKVIELNPGNSNGWARLKRLKNILEKIINVKKRYKRKC